MNNLFHIFTNNYQEAAEQIAIILQDSRNPDEQLTYRELYIGAAGYAYSFENAGVNPGEVIIIILPHGKSLIYAFWGAILHGAIPSIMPFLTEKLSPSHYRKSIEALFSVTSPTAVVTHRDFFEEVNNAKQKSPDVRYVILEDDIKPINISLKSYFGAKRNTKDIVLLQHSSGTTGLQKGVALSHLAVVNQITSYSQAIHLNSSPLGKDVVVSWLPLYHDMGLIAGFIMPILTRTKLVLMSPFDWVRAPSKLLKTISKYNGTLSWLPNFAYNFCSQKIRDCDLVGIDLSTWRAVINCSEPMYHQSHQMFYDRFSPYGLGKNTLATSYAMAENVFAVTQGGIDSQVTIDRIDQHIMSTKKIAEPCSSESKKVDMVSAGTPISNTEVCIFDHHMSLLPERHIGEIAIQSDCMLTGYFKRPDLTQESFHNGWFLTGDLGYLANGEVYITGRKKDLIIVGGKNIYPQDIENIAGFVPGVHPGRVAAFGIYNAELGTEDAVVVAEVDEMDIHKKQTIVDEMREQVNKNSAVSLKYIILVERGWLLKTSSGKVSRSANRKKFLEEKIV